jgi:hypothetical protein
MSTDLRAPVLNWPVWPFQLAIPLGFLSAAVRYFFFALWPACGPCRRSSRNDARLAAGGLMLALLVLRQPLLVILLGVAALVQIVWGKGQLDYILEDMWVGLDKELILSIPLFILCGNVMTKGTTAKRLIRILSAITRPLPGGMAVACILSCGIFAAISGSSIVTMLAIGSVMCRRCGRPATTSSSRWARSCPAARWASSSRRRSR